MKRGNDRAQMSREDFEAEDDNDDDEPTTAGTFQRASADVLATRKIIKILRKGAESASPAPSFTGFAAVPPKLADTIGKAAPVNGASGSADSERCKKIRKLNESFLRWAEKQMETHPLSIWKDGVKDYIKHYQSIEEKYGSSGTESAGAPAVAAAVSFGGFTAAPNTAPVPAAKAPVAAPITFGGFAPAPAPAAAAKPAEASKAPGASPFANFSFAAAPTPASVPAPAPAAAVAKPFSFGAAPAAAPAPAPAASNPFANGFSFGAATTTTAPPAAAAAKPAPIAFGAPPAAGAAPAFGAPFGAGGFGSTAIPNFGGFGSSSSGFGSSTGAAAGADEDGEGGDDEGEPILEPEKVLRNAADTDEILHEVPCKLYSYSTADKEWKDTGKGTFRITRDATTKKQRMLVRNTIGRINFNAGFFPGMKVEQVQKKLKFAAFVSVEDSTLGSDGKAAPPRTEMKNFMLQLKAEDVDATLKKMQAGVASV